MSLKHLVLCLSFSLLVVGNPVAKDSASPVNKLSLPFYKSLVKEAGKNYAYSPLSLATALGMVKEGAGSETLKTLNQLFSNKDPSETVNKVLIGTNDDQNKLKSSNLVLHADSLVLKDGFKTNLENKYHAKLEKFEPSKTEETLKRVNDFVANNTDNMIKKMLDSLDQSTSVLLVNALYLDAKWDTPFENASNREAPFHGTNGDKNVQYLRDTRSLGHLRLESNGLQLVKLGFRGKLSFVVVLPDENKKLDQVLSNLTDEILDENLSKIQYKNIDLSLPKFKVESEYKLKPILGKLGVASIFQPGADLSNMVSGNHAISEAVHKTVIQLNEAGVRASAATEVTIRFTSLLADPVVINIDRPFLFLIRDETTNTNLFVGTVNNI